jgi:hypothetical protein
MCHKTFLVLLFGVFASTLAYKAYENYKVYKVVPQTEVQVQILNDLCERDYEFWIETQLKIGDDARILVAPTQEDEFLKYIKSVGLHTEVAIANIQE